MRRNRRGSGLSGSVNYLARALQTEPTTLEAAFLGLGLALPASANDRPVFVEIGSSVYWLNQDKSGQTWINSRAKQAAAPEAAPVSAPAETTAAGAAAPAQPPAEIPAGPASAGPEAATPAAPATPFAAIRPLLKETRRGGVTAKVGQLAEQLQKSSEDLLAALVEAGLKVPEKAREKPVFVEQAGEVFWLNRNTRGELWVNARESKYAENAGEDGESATDKKPHRPRKKKSETGG
jgi:hypothetical protein